MPKGVKRKPDSIKAGETKQIGKVDEGTADDLSSVDQGADYVKANETVRVAKRQD